MSETPKTELFDHFRVVADHGRDGIARIVTAHDSRSGKLVSLDILDQGDDEARRAVIERALVCKPLADPQLYRVEDVISDHDPPLIVREHDRGIPLAQTLESEGPIEPHEAGQLIARLARVLDRAHAKRIVHGRLSAELIRQSDPEGPFRIAGFGRPLQAIDRQHTHIERLRYAAPEQLDGELPTDLSDLYALGLIFYAMLAGQPAFASHDPTLLAAQIGEGDMPSLSETAPHVPKEFAGLVARLTALSPAERFRTGNALAEAIERVAANVKPVAMPAIKPAEPQRVVKPPSKTRRPVYWQGHLMVACACVAIMTIAALQFWPQDERGAPSAIVDLSSLPNAPAEAGESLPVLPQQTEAGPAEQLPARGWPELLAETRGQGCTTIEPEQRSGSIYLLGVTDDPTLPIELQGELDLHSDISAVHWLRTEPNSAVCRLVGSLLPVTESPPRQMLSLPVGSFPPAIETGDVFVADIAVPLAEPQDEAWHVTVIYADSQGQVTDLARQTHAIQPQEPGSAVRVGEPDRGEWFRVAAPGGADMVLALVTNEPVQPSLQRSQPVDLAIERLVGQLESMKPPRFLSVLPLNVIEN